MDNNTVLTPRPADINAIMMDLRNAFIDVTIHQTSANLLCNYIETLERSRIQPAASEAGAVPDYEDVLRQIGDYAHDRSTGPAVPDALWEIRSMAYDALAAPPAQPEKQAAQDKPYAYEFGRSNGDGTYSVVIERGDLVEVAPRKYEYAAPSDAVKDHPVKPLYDAPPAPSQQAAPGAEPTISPVSQVQFVKWAVDALQTIGWGSDSLAHQGREMLEMVRSAAPAAPIQQAGADACKLRCTTECKAETHGCKSECPALPARPPFAAPAALPTDNKITIDPNAPSLTFATADAERYRAYAIFRQRPDENDGKEFFYHAMWHDQTIPDNGERMVPGWFIPDVAAPAAQGDGDGR
jgi:hypothetical protein